jgi:hypothetical protein
MSKPVKEVVIIGGDSLLLHISVLQALFSKAKQLLMRSPFLVFHPEGNKTRVVDGNDKLLDTINVRIPATIWILFDDFGDHLVVTSLLTSEY